MKAQILILASVVLIMSCNDSTSSKDPVEKADSTNEVKKDAEPAVIAADQSTIDFLVKAADGGMAEVEAGQMGEAKATNAAVKRFAAMMVHDHTGANAAIKTLAAARNVTLPAGVSDEKKKDAAKVGEKSGNDFDKEYMDMMVSDHKKTIDLFEKCEKNGKDEEVRKFVAATLPKLRMHLDSAQAIRKEVK